MKLIYIYMEKFRNFKRQGIAFTDSYRVRVENRDGQAEGLYIKYGEDDKSYKENIHSIHAIVGRNAAGKTNIADIIGMPWGSKDRTDLISEDVAYFLLYAVEDSGEENIYYAEIVGLDHFAGIFELETPAGPGHDLYDSWFRYDPVAHKLTEIRKTELSSNIAETCAAILSLREKFGIQHYFEIEENRYSFCDSYVRRIGCSYTSKDMRDQVRAFWRIVDNNEKFMQEKNQYLSVRCRIDYLDSGPAGKPPLFRIDYAHPLSKEKYLRLRIAESWLKFLLETAANNDLDMREDLILYLEKRFSVLTAVEKDSLAENYIGLLLRYMDFAFEYMQVHADWCSDDTSKMTQCFQNFLAFPHISFRNNGFDILVGDVFRQKKGEPDSKERKVRETREKEIADFLGDIFDSGWAECGGFFKPLWTNTSDGEQAYLQTFTAIEKILNDTNADCRNNILLMDEPEIHMHPDLSRQFVSDLLKWLEMYRSSRKYQIILITHSPFLLSDIERNNVQYIKKDEDGSVSIQRPNSQTFAANIHDILSDAIILDSPYGEYARQEIKTALTQLQTAETSNKEDVDKDAIKKMLQKLSRTVGEPVLAKQLEFLGESV